MTWEIICGCGDHIVFEGREIIGHCLGCDKYYVFVGCPDFQGKPFPYAVEIIPAEEKK